MHNKGLIQKAGVYYNGGMAMKVISTKLYQVGDTFAKTPAGFGVMGGGSVY